MTKVHQYEACVIHHVFQDNGSYAQESQPFPIKFVPLWKNINLNSQLYYQSNNEFVCRDFIGDLICSLRWKKKFNIYGFTSDFNNIREISGATNLSLKLIFPKEQHKKNFKKNISELLMLFKLRNTLNKLYITDYLNDKEHSYVVDGLILTNPLMGSLVTFFFKIAAMDLSECSWSSPKEFIKSIQAKYPNQKDVSYFNRVDIELFDHLYAVESYCHSVACMSYLQKFKNNIGFLHNNSGFFSQFSKNVNISTSYARRIIGHILETLDIKCFNFISISEDELKDILPLKTIFSAHQFNISYADGKFSLVKKSKTIDGFLNNQVLEEISSFNAVTITPMTTANLGLPQWSDEDVEEQEEDEEHFEEDFDEEGL